MNLKLFVWFIQKKKKKQAEIDPDPKNVSTNVENKIKITCQNFHWLEKCISFSSQGFHIIINQYIYHVYISRYVFSYNKTLQSQLPDWLTAVSPDRCIVCEITLIAATAEASGSMLAAHQSPSVIFQHSLHHCTTSCPSLLWLKSQVNALRSRKIFWVIAYWSSAFTATNNIKKKKIERKRWQLLRTGLQSIMWGNI